MTFQLRKGQTSLAFVCNTNRTLLQSLGELGTYMRNERKERLKTACIIPIPPEKSCIITVIVKKDPEEEAKNENVHADHKDYEENIDQASEVVDLEGNLIDVEGKVFNLKYQGHILGEESMTRRYPKRLVKPESLFNFLNPDRLSYHLVTLERTWRAFNVDAVGNIFEITLPRSKHIGHYQIQRPAGQVYEFTKPLENQNVVMMQIEPEKDVEAQGQGQQLGQKQGEEEIKVQEKEKDKEELDSDFLALSSNNVSNASTNASKEQEELRKAMEKMKLELSEKDEELESLQTHVQHLNKDLDDKNNRLHFLETQLERQQGQIDEKDSRMHTLELNVQNLNEQHNWMQGKVQEKEAELLNQTRKMENVLEKHRREIAEKSEEMQALLTTVQELKGQLKSLENTLEEEKKSAKAVLEKANEDLRKQKEEVVERNDTIESMRKSIDCLSTQVEMLKAELLEKDRLRQGDIEQNKALKISIQNMEQSYQKHLKDMEKSFNEKWARMEEHMNKTMKEMQDKSETENGQLRTKLCEQEKERVQFSGTINEMKEMQQKSETDKGQLRKELIEKDKERIQLFEEFSGTINELNTQIQTLTMDNEDLEEQVKAYEKTLHKERKRRNPANCSLNKDVPENKMLIEEAAKYRNRSLTNKNAKANIKQTPDPVRRSQRNENSKSKATPQGVGTTDTKSENTTSNKPWKAQNNRGK